MSRAAPPQPAGMPLLLDRLRSALGAEHVDESAVPRLRCAPGSAAQVAEVLNAARIGGVRVSLASHRDALVQLDLGRLAQVVHTDEDSLLCEVQAGASLAAVERHLRGVGLTLGPLPPRTLLRTVGAVLSAPRPAEASLLLGRLRDRAPRVTAVMPDGQELALPVAVAPRRATGPELRQLLIGARGRAGVLTSATLQVARVPAAVRCAGWFFPGPGSLSAMAALCDVQRLHGGTAPADLQVLSLALLRTLADAGELPPLPGAGAAGGDERGAALLVRADGPAAFCKAQLQRLRQLLGDSGTELPEALCGRWLGMGPVREPGEAVLPQWPRHERALLGPSPAMLAEAFDGCRGPRLLCGVHLHGAALCADQGLPEQVPGADAAGPVLGALLRERYPEPVLC